MKLNVILIIFNYMKYKYFVKIYKVVYIFANYNCKYDANILNESNTKFLILINIIFIILYDFLELS